jgi:hypothetical protein
VENERPPHLRLSQDFRDAVHHGVGIREVTFRHLNQVSEGSRAISERHKRGHHSGRVQTRLRIVDDPSSSVANRFSCVIAALCPLTSVPWAARR